MGITYYREMSLSDTQTTDEKGATVKKPLSVSVQSNQMEIVVDIAEKQPDLEICADRIAKALVKLNAAKPMSGDEILEWLAETMDSEGLIEHGVLIAGTSPVYPVDGKIEWADDFFNRGFKIDPETGQVDYRQTVGRSSVSEGELLATIVPGVPGKNGKNVCGDKIPVANPKIAKLNAGSNVRRNDADDTFYSEADGRVELINGVLSVSDVYVISGDVGLESGNVDHPGSIIVEQDVLEDSKVHATGDIEIHGLVEAADITTDGNLYVSGGICGKEGTSIRVAGEVHAMYIRDCDIEAGGDIVVAREMVHSDVRAQGTVRVPGGRIIGGTTTALGGIDVGEAGSDAFVKTKLLPGVDFALEAMIEEDSQEITSLTEQRDKIQEFLKPLLPGIESLPDGKRAMVDKLVVNEKSLNEKLDAIERKLEARKKMSEDNGEHSIRVRTTLFSETKVCIQHEWNKFKQTFTGPLKIECVAGEIRARSELK